MNSQNTLPPPSQYRFSVCTDCKDTGSRNQAHDLFEVMILQHGKGTCLINDTLFAMCAGDIILFPPHTIHNTTYTSDRHSRVCMLLMDSYIPPYIYDLCSSGHYIYRNPKVYSSISPLLSAIEAEYAYKDSLCANMITSYLYIFFSTIYRHQNHYNYERNGTTVFVEKILEYVKNNFAYNITLGVTAEKYSISPQYLSSIFKKETGMNFNEYVTTVRLNYAEQLLRQPNKKSIAEIAYACGFNDSNYFSYRFKQEYGVSPLQFSKS